MRLRVPVDCNDDTGRCPHAPLLGAELTIEDTTGQVIFLIDTGADISLIDQTALALPRATMKKGQRVEAKGVGGAWPARGFRGATLRVLARDDDGGEHGVELEVPRIWSMAPFAERVGGNTLKEDLGPVARTDRRLRGKTPRLRQSPTLVPLLGRDIFRENGLTLEWAPLGQSWIHLEI